MEDSEIRYVALQHAMENSGGQSAETIIDKAKLFEKYLNGPKKRIPRKSKELEVAVTA